MPEATVTIPGVELVKVGTWPATTGRTTVTAEHLADMVAAQADPLLRTAPLKLGHTGALSTLGDSEPAFGYATNLRLSEDGDTLVGDLTDIPAALEQPIKAGFKQRSAEIFWKVKTGAGATYSAVLDALALLGVKQPAVSGLADLAALYRPSTALAAGVTVDERSSLALYDMPSDPLEPTHAERITNQVRWAKTSAAELAALVGIAGLDAVFAAIDAMATTDGRGLLSTAPHHEPVTTASTPGGTMPTKTIKPEDLPKVRAHLGLADDATEEQVIERLTELDGLVAANKDEPAPTTTGTPAPAPEPAPQPERAALSAATIAELAKAGLTVLPTPALEQLQAGAQAGAAAHSQLAAQNRDALLDEAQRLGKFGAGEPAAKVRSTFSAQLDKDFEGTKAVIDSLPALVPVGELGNSSTGPDHTDFAEGDNAAWDAWESQVFGTELNSREG